jgi:hypothetical protein
VLIALIIFLPDGIVGTRSWAARAADAPRRRAGPSEWPSRTVAEEAQGNA